MKQFFYIICIIYILREEFYTKGLNRYCYCKLLLVCNSVFFVVVYWKKEFTIIFIKLIIIYFFF